MKYMLGLVVVFLTVVWIFLTVLDEALGVAEVHVSYSTGECVRIVDEDGVRGCSASLPARYSQIWVD